jgi:hypothetical protein
MPEVRTPPNSTESNCLGEMFAECLQSSAVEMNKTLIYKQIRAIWLWARWDANPQEVAPGRF